METQFIYKRMALPKDSVDVDGLTLTLTDKRTHGNVGYERTPSVWRTVGITDLAPISSISPRFHVSVNVNVSRKRQRNHQPTLSVNMSSVFPCIRFS